MSHLRSVAAPVVGLHKFLLLFRECFLDLRERDVPASALQLDERNRERGRLGLFKPQEGIRCGLPGEAKKISVGDVTRAGIVRSQIASSSGYSGMARDKTRLRRSICTAPQTVSKSKTFSRAAAAVKQGM
jgi:hypothetical protein